MPQQDNTKLVPIPDDRNKASRILTEVYQALQTRGYDPCAQLASYLISGDPTYITSYNNARSLICRLETDEILEELVRTYFNVHKAELS